MLKAAYPERPDALTWVFLGLGLLLLPLGLYLALAAPPDVNQGYLVRIMYLHVPGAWLGYLAFLVTFLYSLLYLFRQAPATTGWPRPAPRSAWSSWAWPW